MRFLKRAPKPTPRNQADRYKASGAREYNARVHERTAERLDLAGDTEGAEAERDAAKEARRPPAR